VVLFAREKKKNLFQVSLFEEVVLSAKGEGKASKEKQKIYNLLIDSRPYLYLIKYY